MQGPHDIAQWRSEKHGRGPLKEDFHADHDPIVTVYSVVFFKLEAPLLQETVEDLLLAWGVKDNLAAVHRRCVTHFDEWAELTMDDLDAYENKVLMEAEKK